MKAMKKATCILLAVILAFGVTMPAQAAKNKKISKKNAVKIVNDITEYLAEQCTYGKGYGTVKFDSFNKSQMACRLCKLHKLSKKDKKVIKFTKSDKEYLEEFEYAYLKETEIKKNMKNLFGTTKFKINQSSEPAAWYAFTRNVKGKKQKKILVMSPGGTFRLTKQKYKASNIKITGKTTKKVRFDVGWYYGVDKNGKACWDNKAVRQIFRKGGTYTITLKPANNKYGCIITNIKENQREPGGYT